MSWSQDNQGTQQIILPRPKINSDFCTSNTTAIFKSCFFLPLPREPRSSVQSHQTGCSCHLHAGAGGTLLPAWPQSGPVTTHHPQTHALTLLATLLLSMLLTHPFFFFPSLSDCLRLQVFGKFFRRAGIEMPRAAPPLGLDQGLHIFRGSPVRCWCCMAHPILQPGRKGQIILCGSHSEF